MVLHAPIGHLERRSHTTWIAAIGQRASADELAQARRAHGQQRMRRHRVHAPQVQQAFARIARREGVDEFPRLDLGGATDHGDDLMLVHGIGSAMRKRDLLELAVEVHRVLAHQIH